MKKKRRRKKVAPPPREPPGLEIFQQYRDALDRALQLSTTRNVPPIMGQTVVLCKGSSSMRAKIKSAGRQGGKSQRRLVEVRVCFFLYIFLCFIYLRVFFWYPIFATSRPLNPCPHTNTTYHPLSSYLS